MRHCNYSYNTVRRKVWRFFGVCIRNVGIRLLRNDLSLKLVATSLGIALDFCITMCYNLIRSNNEDQKQYLEKELMKKPETVLTAFRLPKTLSDQVDRVSNGNRSEYIRKAVTEKLEREKEQNV